MKELRLSAALLQEQEAAFCALAAQGRKATPSHMKMEFFFSNAEEEAKYKAANAALKASSLKAAEEASKLLTGEDYCLTQMSEEDLKRCLQMASWIRFQELLEKHSKRMKANASAEAFKVRRAKSAHKAALRSLKEQASFMVDETLYYMKETLPLKGKSYGEVKCLLKGLATEAMRSSAECKGLDKIFYRDLAEELWSSSTVRFFMKK